MKQSKDLFYILQMKLRSAIEKKLNCFVSFHFIHKLCFVLCDEEETIDEKERSKADKHDSTVAIPIYEVELSVAIKINGISLLTFPSDINGLVMQVLTSGTLTQVCRNWTVCTDLLLFDSRHHVTQILTFTTSI